MHCESNECKHRQVQKNLNNSSAHRRVDNQGGAPVDCKPVKLHESQGYESRVLSSTRGEVVKAVTAFPNTIYCQIGIRDATKKHLNSCSLHQQLTGKNCKETMKSCVLRWLESRFLPSKSEKPNLRATFQHFSIELVPRAQSLCPMLAFFSAQPL